jgi:cytidylate kinase
MPLITISQDFGSEGYAIAKQVAESLELDLYDDERLKEEALKEGIRPEYLKGLEEKAPGFFDRLMGRKPDIYLDILKSVVYHISRTGDGIVVGHGSQMLLKDFNCALHIRIYASMQKRAEALAQQENLSYEAAEKIIRNKDEEYKGFFKYAFQMDPNNPELYDLFLNTGKISAETAARYIADLARSDDIKACSLAVLESMDRMSLERKIHAELSEHGIFPKMISIEVSGTGTACVYGVTSSESEKDRIVDVVTNMKEIDRIENNIVVAKGMYI